MVHTPMLRAYARTANLRLALTYQSLKRRDISGQAVQKAEDAEGQDGEEKAKAGADLGKIVNLMQ